MPAYIRLRRAVQALLVVAGSALCAAPNAGAQGPSRFEFTVSGDDDPYVRGVAGYAVTRLSSDGGDVLLVTLRGPHTVRTPAIVLTLLIPADTRAGAVLAIGDLELALSEGPAHGLAYAMADIPPRGEHHSLPASGEVRILRSEKGSIGGRFRFRASRKEGGTVEINGYFDASRQPLDDVVGSRSQVR